MLLRPLILAFLLFAAAPAFNTVAHAQDYECVRPNSLDLAKGNLELVLARHEEWLSIPSEERDLDDERRANLCEARLLGNRLARAAEQAGLSRVDLRYANLNGANLFGAKLNCLDPGASDQEERRCAYLQETELNRADLRMARLNEASLSGAKLNGADLRMARLNGADLTGAELNGANLQEAKLNCLNPGTSDPRCANLSKAELNGADLTGAKLNEARLFGAELKEAVLTLAELNRADLRRAELNGAILWAIELNRANLEGAKLNRVSALEAKLNRAYLNRAELNGANLEQAELNRATLSNAKLNCLNPGTPEECCADLSRAELNGANLSGAELSGVDLRLADMTGVIFELDLAFSDRDFRLAKNLHLMRFEENPDALMQLRRGFREAGHRNLERQITYAIKRTERLDAQKKGGLGRIEAGFNFVLFELTTEWGMSPGRALRILLLVALIAAFFYIDAVYGRESEKGAIYRVDEGKPEKKDWRIVSASGLRALGWGLYFSLLSAFHIGFRELNIGNWIQRINPHDYSVRASGWVKTLSGVQSVLSVYLLAIWALTYFGRPFD